MLRILIVRETGQRHQTPDEVSFNRESGPRGRDQRREPVPEKKKKVQTQSEVQLY